MESTFTGIGQKILDLEEIVENPSNMKRGNQVDEILRAGPRGTMLENQFFYVFWKKSASQGGGYLAENDAPAGF